MPEDEEAVMIAEGKPGEDRLEEDLREGGDFLVGVVLRAELLKEGEAADEE